MPHAGSPDDTCSDCPADPIGSRDGAGVAFSMIRSPAVVSTPRLSVFPALVSPAPAVTSPAPENWAQLIAVVPTVNGPCPLTVNPAPPFTVPASVNVNAPGTSAAWFMSAARVSTYATDTVPRVVIT